MAHELEIVDGVAHMAYAGETPWHGLGVNVPDDLTPQQMMEAAHLDWEVAKRQMFYTNNGCNYATDSQALIRTKDNKLLDVVSDDWSPVQNVEAFDFFNQFIAAGDMSMETAGSLQGGKIVWGLAKVKQSFELFNKKDLIEAYLLFSNFHKYGYSTDVRFTPVRAVCKNTLTLALSSSVDRMVKVTHRSQFQPEKVKEMLGIASEKMKEYKEMGEFLGKKKYSNENIVEYFKRVFPVTGPSKIKETSKNAKIALDIVETQPGAEFASGSWWNAFNAVTFITDHVTGRSTDNRLTSAWYGQNKNVKTSALNLAVEYAEAA